MDVFGFLLHKNVLKYIATLGPVGFLPYAPGTWGTLAALLLVILLIPDDSLLLMILLPAGLVGILASARAGMILGRDSGHIVIDEFCGYLISVLFLPRSGLTLFIAFVLFRLFDALKPPPIKWIERTLAGGVGVMADDILAAVYTNICLQIVWRLL